MTLRVKGKNVTARGNFVKGDLEIEAENVTLENNRAKKTIVLSPIALSDLKCDFSIKKECKVDKNGYPNCKKCEFNKQCGDYLNGVDY